LTCKPARDPTAGGTGGNNGGGTDKAAKDKQAGSNKGGAEAATPAAAEPKQQNPKGWCTATLETAKVYRAHRRLTVLPHNRCTYGRWSSSELGNEAPITVDKAQRLTVSDLRNPLLHPERG
jgi:hypothetical protein